MAAVSTTTTTPAFEAIRNENGNLYKLLGKLSKNKVADITLVPKTKMAYMHISDYSNAWDEGKYDKNASKFVSLNMKASVLRQLMSGMDGPVQELIKSVPPAAKKRKIENVQQIPAYVTSGQSSGIQDAQVMQQRQIYGADQNFQPLMGQMAQQAVANAYPMNFQQPTAGHYLVNQQPMAGQYPVNRQMQNYQATLPNAQYHTDANAAGQNYQYEQYWAQQGQGAGQTDGPVDVINQLFAEYQ